MEDEEQISESITSGDVYNLFSISHSFVRPLIVSLLINGKQLGMEVDTGAAVSVMGQKSLINFGLVMILKRTNVRICTYTGQEIKPCVEALVEVSYVITTILNVYQLLYYIAGLKLA